MIKTTPPDDSLPVWKDIFRNHFDSINVEHMTFAWDSIEGSEESTDLFVNVGFVLEKSIVMLVKLKLRLK